MVHKQADTLSIFFVVFSTCFCMELQSQYFVIYSIHSKNDKLRISVQIMATKQNSYQSIEPSVLKITGPKAVVKLNYKI